MGLLSTIGGIAGSFFGGPVGGMIGSTIGGAIEGEDRVDQASNAQVAAADAGIAEQRRQFDAVRELLKPYTQAGSTALTGMQEYTKAGIPAFEMQQALAGILGPERQRAAMAQIEADPGFQNQIRMGENALLQNASATGGLRGGNIQAALAQFRPEMLRMEIDRRYNQLGGLANTGLTTQQNIASLGQSSAAGVGNAGLNMANSVSNLLGQQGAARAGAALQGDQLGRALPGIFGAIQGAGGFGKVFPSIFGGSSGGGVSGLGSINPSSGEFMGSLEF